MRTTDHPEALTGRYELDPRRSRIEFAVRSLFATVKGRLTPCEGFGLLDLENLDRSMLEVHLDAMSLDTSNRRRDAHLRSDAFLGARAHPRISFTSTSVKPEGARRFLVTGTLTMKGVARGATMEVDLRPSASHSDGPPEITLEGKVLLQRRDWGVTWNRLLEGGGVLVGDLVQVRFTAVAVSR